jgi:hypothetical protein
MLTGARTADGQVVGPLPLPDPRSIHEAVAAGIDRTPAATAAAAASTAGQPPQGQAGSHVHNQWQPRYRGLAYMNPATPGRDASGQPASLVGDGGGGAGWPVSEEGALWALHTIGPCGAWRFDKT